MKLLKDYKKLIKKLDKAPSDLDMKYFRLEGKYINENQFLMDVFLKRETVKKDKKKQRVKKKVSINLWNKWKLKDLFRSNGLDFSFGYDYSENVVFIKNLKFLEHCKKILNVIDEKNDMNIRRDDNQVINNDNKTIDIYTEMERVLEKNNYDVEDSILQLIYDEEFYSSIKENEKIHNFLELELEL
jgi:hypothetical protein